MSKAPRGMSDLISWTQQGKFDGKCGFKTECWVQKTTRERVCVKAQKCEKTTSSWGAEDSGCGVESTGVESWQVQDE